MSGDKNASPVAFAVFVVAFFLSISSSAQGSVSQGRSLLFGNRSSSYENFVDANDEFGPAVQNTNSDEANFFYAVTRVPAFFFRTGSKSDRLTIRADEGMLETDKFFILKTPQGRRQGRRLSTDVLLLPRSRVKVNGEF